MIDIVAVRAFDVRVNSYRGSTILVRGQEVYELQEIEKFIWSLCDGKRTAGQIADEVANNFDTDKASACADVLDFLGQLRDEQLIEVNET